MAEYLDKSHALLHDFNELLPSTSTPSKEFKQKSKFMLSTIFLIIIHMFVIKLSLLIQNDQLIDIFTKSLYGPRTGYICNKLGTYYLEASA